MLFYRVFNENRVIVMPKSAGGRPGFRRQLWFPHKNLSLLWLFDTKLFVWAAYIMMQLGIAT
jgi:hypothetical protein